MCGKCNCSKRERESDPNGDDDDDDCLAHAHACYTHTQSMTTPSKKVNSNVLESVVGNIGADFQIPRDTLAFQQFAACHNGFF